MPETDDDEMRRAANAEGSFWPGTATQRCQAGRYQGRGQRSSRVPACGRVLPMAAFAPNPRCIGGRDSRCMLCARLWGFYRLSYAGYMQIAERQHGVCAILGCSTPVQPGSGKTGAHVDHDHDCQHEGRGKSSCAECVRGILCARCNVAIGWLEKYPELVVAWVRYLQHEGQKGGFGWTLGALTG